MKNYAEFIQFANIEISEDSLIVYSRLFKNEETIINNLLTLKSYLLHDVMKFSLRVSNNFSITDNNKKAIVSKIATRNKKQYNKRVKELARYYFDYNSQNLITLQKNINICFNKANIYNYNIVNAIEQYYCLIEFFELNTENSKFKLSKNSLMYLYNTLVNSKENNYYAEMRNNDCEQVYKEIRELISLEKINYENEKFSKVNFIELYKYASDIFKIQLKELCLLKEFNKQNILTLLITE